MRGRARALALALAFVVALPTLPIGNAGAGTPPPTDILGNAPGAAPLSTLLRMKAGTFDPATDLVPAPPELLSPLLPAAGATSSDGRVRFILQFLDGVNPERIRSLSARGIFYERYLPDGGMIASAEPRDVPRSAAAVGARALLALHPALRLDPSLFALATDPRGGAVRLDVLLFDTPDPLAALAPLARVVAFDGRMAIVDAAPSALKALANLADAEWIDAYAPPTLAMDYATRILSARQATDGAFSNDGRSVWAYEPSTDSFSGLTGKGVVVNIGDTGIDASHPAFDGRIVAAFGSSLYNATCDCYGIPHGTHVAGIVAGNGSWRPADTNRTDGKYAGVAPEAGLVAQVVFGNARTPTQLSQEALSAGAFINSNSWGGGADGAYTSNSQTYDDLVIDANGRDAGTPQMVYVFAAGNSGSGPSTVESPSTAKNVISVGATGNVRYSSPDTIAGFSSRGPAADGRLKPDLVAPGEGVVSTRGQNWGCEGGELNCSYYTLSGTSMATPAVSGAAALVTQWLSQTRGGLPSAAMVKAVLIDGATPLPYLTWPDNNQGWGRVNVSRSVNEGPSFRHETWDEGPALAQVAGRTSASFRIFAESDEEMRIVLVWSDVPGTSSSAKALINDLDLEVKGPDGRVYFGNSFADGYSFANGTRDAVNNTEVVRVKAPQRGEWTLTVRASSIPSGDQRFALAASGNITTSWVSLTAGAVEITPASPREDDPLLVIVPVLNTGTLYPGNFEVAATLEGPEGVTGATARVINIRPGDDFPATFTFAPKRGAHTVRVVVDPGGATGDRVADDNEADADVFVAGFEVGLLPVRTFSTLPPRASDTFVVALSNRGNVNDTVVLSPSADDGWTLALNATSSSLAPGESAFLAGTLTAPDRALAGAVGRVNINASSTGNASRRAFLAFAVEVQAAPGSRVVQGPFAKTAGPGENATFDLVIENTGNTPLSLGLEAQFVQTAPAGFQLTIPTRTLALPAFAEANLSIEVVVPPDAVASAYRSIVARIASPDEGTTVELVYQLAVGRTSGLSLLEAPAARAGVPGDTLRFPMLVRNDGNAREAYSVGASPAGAPSPGVAFSVENATMTLEPFSEGYATAVVELRPFAAQGAYRGTLEVRAASGEAVSAPLEATVEAVHAFEIEGPSRITVRQGGSGVLRATLHNLGNVGEALALSIEAPPGALTVSGWNATRTVEAGASVVVEVHLSAGTDAALGLVSLRLRAESALNATVAPATLDVSVNVAPGAASAPPFLPGLGTAPLVLAVVATALIVRRRRGAA